MKQRNGIIVN